MQGFAINEKYPFELPEDEAVIANFLRPAANQLLIALRGIDAQELAALRSGKVSCGVLHSGGAIMLIWAFQVGHETVLTFASPFDARRVSDCALHSITGTQQRLAIDLHAVELDSETVKVIRSFALPHEITLAFLSAVQIQLAATGGDDQLMAWLETDPAELARRADMVSV